MPISPAACALLAAGVFFAGIVDALAGGGGLVTVPAYLASGLNPALVLGTNKVSSCIGTLVATARYHRAQRLPFRRFWPVIAAALAAAWFGARLATRLDPSWLRPLLLAALPFVAWTVWSGRGLGDEDASGRRDPAARLRRELAVAAPVGAYDGFFGPGAGTFYALGFVRVCGYDLVGATARAKVANLATNLGALIAFAAAGRVQWPLGLSMAAAGVAGNWVGAHLGVKRGAAAIRPMIALVCAGLFAKLLRDALTGRP